MIGIYQDSFLTYLKNKLGDPIKTTSKNIICPCPFCEYGKTKDHYHMYISLEIPIFHCFHAGCEETGTLRKFITKIEGHDISETFVDKVKLAEIKKKQNVFEDKEQHKLNIKIPVLNRNQFRDKDFYIKQRFKFADINNSNVKGLIYDVNGFIELNQIEVDNPLYRIKDYLQSNFVGFLTENQSTVIFRNIDHSQHMGFYKLKLQEINFLDYYKLKGNSPKSNQIVLAEGVFDIFTEYLFDSLNIKNNIRLYATALSANFIALIKSIIFYEQIFQPEVIVLSDRDVSKKYYEKLKFFNKHIIKKLTVYYNKSGKDFNCTPITPLKIII